MLNRNLMAALVLAAASSAVFAAPTNTDAKVVEGKSDHHCDDAVSLFYLGNPAASSGFYNNPWADCKPQAGSR